MVGEKIATPSEGCNGTTVPTTLAGLADNPPLRTSVQQGSSYVGHATDSIG
jgi:hypothetical protein